MRYDYLIKTIIIGNSGVGKSTFLERLVNPEHVFSTDINTTIGVDFFVYSMVVNGKTYKFHIYDTAGQESFHSIVRTFYREKAVCFLMYDVGDKKSFEDVQSWIKEIKASSPGIIFVLLGNKIDRQPIEVSENEQNLYSDKNEFISCRVSGRIRLFDNFLGRTINVLRAKENFPNLIGMKSGIVSKSRECCSTIQTKNNECCVIY